LGRIFKETLLSKRVSLKEILFWENEVFPEIVFLCVLRVLCDKNGVFL